MINGIRNSIYWHSQISDVVIPPDCTLDKTCLLYAYFMILICIFVGAEQAKETIYYSTDNGNV